MNLLALAAEHSSGAHTFDYRHLGLSLDCGLCMMQTLCLMMGNEFSHATIDFAIYSKKYILI